MKTSIPKYCSTFFILIMFTSIACNKELKIEPVQAESFIKFYGNSYDDYARDILQTDDGGYVIVGNTQSVIAGVAGMAHVFMMKTDKFGNIDWGPKIYNAENNAEVNRVLALPDGGFIIIGNAEVTRGSSTDKDIRVIRTTSTGDSVWIKKFGGIRDDVGLTGLITKDGECMIGGYFNDGTRKKIKLFTINLDGVVTWDYYDIAPFSVDDGDWMLSGSAGSADGYVFVGSVSNSSKTGINPRVLILGIDAALENQKYNVYSEDNAATGRDVFVHDDGTISILADITGGNGTSDIGLFKVTGRISDDSVLWYKQYGGPGNQVPGSICYASSEGYYISGTTYRSGNNNIYLLRLDKDGNVIFENDFGNGSDQEGYRSIHCSDGGCAVAGASDANGDWQVAIIKTRPGGEL